MRNHYISFLSILFLITACNSSTHPALVEPTIATTLGSTPTAVFPIEPTTETKTEVVVLDFAISPDGKQLAIYLNTGVYIYDAVTSERTAFYQFESNEYYSELNAGATIYPPFGAPGALAFSPNGSELAISGKFKDEYIAVWDLMTHKISYYIANYPNGNYVKELAYHPNDETILIRSTYPLSQLHCVEIGGSEDTLTLVDLASKNNLFEAKVCNTYFSIESHFSDNNTMSLYYYGESPFHQVRIVDTQTGKIIEEYEFDARVDGLAYDLSSNGKAIAVRDDSSLSDGVYRTNLIDATTKKKTMSLTGMVDFLDSESRFLNLSEGQLQLQESDSAICVFNGLEYYRPYTRVSKDSSTMASLDFENRTFQNSVQVWDIPRCQLINTIPIR